MSDGQKKFLIIGHRGLPGSAPENTLKSFRMALLSGADGVELDVQLSKDGVPVTFHDFTTGRMCGQDTPISAMNFAEIRNLKVAGSEPVPTLKEALESLSGKAVFVELKISATRDVSYRRNVCGRIREVIESSRMKENVIITSFDHDGLRLYRELDRRQQIGIIYDRESMAFYAERGMDPESIIDSYSILIPDYTYHAAEDIRLLSEHGKKIFPWTVNDPGIAKVMKEAGCSGIITDFADRMLLLQD